MNHGGNRKGAGRPKGSKASHTLAASKAREYLVQEVIKELEEILRPQIEKAKQGDTAAYKDLLDRTMGKPMQTIEMDSGISIELDF